MFWPVASEIWPPQVKLTPAGEHVAPVGHPELLGLTEAARKGAVALAGTLMWNCSSKCEWWGSWMRSVTRL